MSTPAGEAAEEYDVDVDADDVESEGDLPGAGERASEAVVTATDWTTETILNQLRRGNIQLNPRFQRRDAWTRPRKSRFIESLFLGLPIPQIVLAEARGKRGSYVVIDGKQRLLALRQFAANVDDEFRPLRLSGLDALPELNGKTLQDVEADVELHDAQAAFDNQTIRTVVVRNWPDEDFLYLVFLRLNTGSVPLSPQELRQALHPGPFVDFADQFTADSDPIRRALKLTRPDFRMRDVELLVRFFTFTRFLREYDGNLKRSLDRTCETLNGEWEDGEEQVLREAASCERAIEATLGIFGVHAFRRFDGDRWEGRFNRAVFDSMIYYFRDVAVAEQATVVAEEIVKAFKGVSKDPVFQESVRSTTKTVGATHARIALWGAELSRVVGIDLEIPQLLDGRIDFG